MSLPSEYEPERQVSQVTAVIVSESVCIMRVDGQISEGYAVTWGYGRAVFYPSARFPVHHGENGKEQQQTPALRNI